MILIRTIPAALLVAALTPSFSLLAQSGQQDPIATSRRVASIASIALSEYQAGMRDGRVFAIEEVEEARLFLTQARSRAEQLPDSVRAAALPGIDALIAAVEQRRPVEVLSAGVDSLRAILTRMVGEGLDPMPEAPPSLTRAREHFAAMCAQCHGDNGRGDGSMASSLTPPPTNLTDSAIMVSASPLDVFRKVSFGVAGTAMSAFEYRLTIQDRWAVALYVSSLRYSDADRRRGEVAARHCPGCLLVISDAAATAPLTDDSLMALARREGVADSSLLAFVAFARTAGTAEVLGGDRRLEAARVIAQTRAGVAEADSLGEAGDARRAEERALEAYLVFERIETSVRARDARAAARVERAFADLRAELARGDRAAAGRARAGVESALDEALAPVARMSTAPTLFGQSLVIMLREGLEAILIIGALTAVLVRAGAAERRREIGWGVLAALVASLATAALFAGMLSRATARREALEGGTMLVAAVVLFWVSYWLVSKIETKRWQSFVRDQVTRALTRGGALALAGVAFLAVYREGFETVLFYAALFAAGDGTRGGGAAIIAGIVAGGAALGVVYFVIQRYGVRLPLKPFFGVTSALLYLMAFSFAGQGIAELQEAGYIRATPIDWAPSFPFLGIFPTIQTMAIQLVLVLAIVGALAWVFWVQTARRPGPAG